MLASGLFKEDLRCIFLFLEGKDDLVCCTAPSIEGDHATENLLRINLFLNDFLKLLALYSQPM